MANKAVVVFHGQGTGFWPAVLGREGFRHCYVVVPSGDYWILLDGRAGSPLLAVMGGTKEHDVAAFLNKEGNTVIEAEMPFEYDSLWPLMIGNCVGAIKKVLGVRNPFILTPYQLYRHLRCQHLKDTKKGK